MKVIHPHYRVELNWIEVLAEALGGVIDHNFIRGNNDTYQGVHYVDSIEPDITAMLEDTNYKEDVRIKYTNSDADFVGIYYYSLEGANIGLAVDETERNLLGQFNYNISILDSDLDLDYIIDKDTNAYTICIFIKKKALKRYFKNMPELEPLAEEIFNRETNTIVRLNRMTIYSALLIQNFRKISYDNPFYGFYFKGLINSLLSEYLQQLRLDKIVIGKAIDQDFRRILESKVFLLHSLEGDFPGVEALAEMVSMSSSKYKKLFTKITGSSPGVYFQSNKLYQAKELLATGQYTIGEVAVKLNYSSISYLAKRFKEAYGIYPKEYQNLL
ncbi:helix-turn-helix transcriptional regulator [Flavobacterium sp. JP2137]|uniref:helix-turn-helix transcriptional regulator n=1 Tax=Flavobacterium sp. JP2137 TaxID=3414510 RepID=UPI003D2FDE89